MVLLSASVSSSESTHDGDNVQSGRVRAWDWTKWKIHALPSPSTLSKYRRPRSAVVPVQGRAVDVVDYCAHKQVRYRRQINLNRSFAGCRRDASKGTRAMSLRKDGQGTKTTSPAALA